MGRRSVLERLAELAGSLQLSDPADGWPGLGSIQIDGVTIPVAIWIGPIGKSHRGRDGVERRFQNPGSNRPIWADSQRQPLLLGLWDSDPLVRVQRPVVVAADPRRREGRTTRFSVFMNLASLQAAADAAWAEHRNDDGELLRYAVPERLPDLLLAGKDSRGGPVSSAGGGGAIAQTDAIILLARSGLTLDEIGAEVGLTRERVRQILNARAPDVAAARKVLAARRRMHLAARQRHSEAADRLHRLSEELLARGTDASAVLEHLQRSRIPTVTAKRFGIPSDTVLALYDASVFDFPLVRRPVEPELRFDHEACIRYLQTAAEELGVDLLTVAAYEDFASRQTLTPEAWPSAQTVMKRFDGWREATSAAGLSARGRGRGEYVQRFPAARCREFVDRYVTAALASEERPTLAGYGDWTRDNGGPSPTTLRNRLGRWSDVLVASLRRLEA